MAVIIGFDINQQGIITVTVDRHTDKPFQVFYKATVNDGGNALLDACREYVGNASGFLYYDGQTIVQRLKPYEYLVWDWDNLDWFDPRTEEEQWEKVRKQRYLLLSQSDWTQLPDVPLATKEAWATYRQALRDVTLQPDPFNIAWPIPPQ